MNRRTVAAVGTAGLAVTTLVACDPPKVEDQAVRMTVADGSRTLSRNDAGIWDAPGGTLCRWWKQSANGKRITDNGNTEWNKKHTARVQKSGKQAEQSQTMVIGTGNAGDKLKSDNCKGWKRRK